MNTVPRGTARHGLWGPGDTTAVIVTVAGMLTDDRQSGFLWFWPTSASALSQCRKCVLCLYTSDRNSHFLN